jgi:hypothetical protein
MEGIAQDLIWEDVSELFRMTEENHKIPRVGTCLRLDLNVKIFGEFLLNFVLDGQG